MNAVRSFCMAVLRRSMLPVSLNIGRKKLITSLTLRPLSHKCLALVPSVLTVAAFTKKTNNIIQKADDLYEENKFVELHLLLSPYKETRDPEILWRLARATFEVSRDMKSAEKLQALEEALELVNEALAIKEECWAAHKWKAILLDYVWQCKSTKGRIINSFEVKKHMERAIELNPSDSTSYYILGEWCFTFADMPWYQRKVAATIFANPPTSSYEEALKNFKKAEEMSPMFYSMNLLMLGKCLLRMNRKEDAIEYLKKAESYQIKTADDRKAQEEAANILKELKAK